MRLYDAANGGLCIRKVPAFSKGNEVTAFSLGQICPLKKGVGDYFCNVSSIIRERERERESEFMREFAVKTDSLSITGIISQCKKNCQQNEWEMLHFYLTK